MQQPFLNAVPVLEQIENAGFEAYFVGGAVRDFLMKKPISDVDIATSATPDEIKDIFSKTVDTGIEHGTVLVIKGRDAYEVTTFRTEAAYEDFRRPSDVTFIRSLKEDLKRRDFTINAIAMDKNGRIIDPFHGRKAIEEQKIVTVGNPMHRFSEDALRMVRAIRFASQLTFTIEPKTYQALIEHGHLLKRIATERKTAEFEKILGGSDRIRAVKILLDTGIYQYLPGLSCKKEGLEQFSSYHSINLSLDEMWVLLIFSLKIDLLEIEGFLRGWKLSTKKIKKLTKIRKWLHFRMEHEWSRHDLYQATKGIAIHTEKVVNVARGRECQSNVNALGAMHDGLAIKDRTELSATGTDLMQWTGQKGGPWIKETLETVEKEIVENRLENNKASIREWLMKCSNRS